MPRLTVPHCVGNTFLRGGSQSASTNNASSMRVLTCHDQRDRCYSSQSQVCWQSESLDTP